MSDQYVGEIRMFAGGYAPQGWALCNGQFLSITDNPALFALLGTTYGGDGMTTFGVPDMRGRVPVSVGIGGGSNYVLGQKSGAESVTLLASQMPAHNHLPAAQSAPGNQPSPTNNVWASKQVFEKPGADIPLVAMSSAAVIAAGDNQSHDNLMPFMALTFIIAIQGIFPSQA
jgi:microcystin-dependent protein